MTNNTALPVTHVATSDISDMLDPIPGRRMSLPDFDEEFVDFPDYIVRITHRIWHARRVELCRKYYTEDCVIHTLAGDIHGVQAVIDNTQATLQAFPDRRLDADNVIWADDGERGFYSSHLITSKMTNLGDSEFGAATGKKIRVRTIADCACRANQVYEEWLVRDYAAMVAQLGFDVDQTAHKLAQADIAVGTSLIDFHAPSHRALMSQGESKLPLSSASPSAQDFVAHYAKAIWQRRGATIAKEPDSPDVHDSSPSNRIAYPPAAYPHVREDAKGRVLHSNPAYALLYDYRVAAHYPALHDFYGADEVAAFHDQLFAAFPDAQISVEHIASTAYLGDAEDVAVRWRLAGTHSGGGADSLYGQASGAAVVILAVSHWRIINGRIREEVCIWDDVAVRRQIATARLTG